MMCDYGHDFFDSIMCSLNNILNKYKTNISFSLMRPTFCCFKEPLAIMVILNFSLNKIIFDNLICLVFVHYRCSMKLGKSVKGPGTLPQW